MVAKFGPKLRLQLERQPACIGIQRSIYSLAEDLELFADYMRISVQCNRLCFFFLLIGMRRSTIGSGNLKKKAKHVITYRIM